MIKKSFTVCYCSGTVYLISADNQFNHISSNGYKVADTWYIADVRWDTYKAKSDQTE